MDTVDIIASGDHHFHEGPRFAECVRVHAWIAKRVAEVRPRVFLSAGDIYEAASTPIERAAVSEWLIEVADTCPVLIARGNHDRRHDLEILAKLRTKHPIIVEEGARVHKIAGLDIAVMAWPSTAMLAAALGEPVSKDVSDAFAREMMAAVLLGLGSELKDSCASARVLLTHAMIDGSVTSLGQPLIGCEMNVALAELGLVGADIVIAGHIHKPQAFAFNGPILYTGSPYRTAFGEVEEKSVLEVRAVCTRAGVVPLEWRRTATPSTPMNLMECEWRAGALVVAGPEAGRGADIVGAEVRLRYTVAADERDAAKRAAAEMKATLLASGCASVVVEEEVQAVTRARAPEVAAARTTEDKLRAMWRARGNEPTEERAVRIFGKLATLRDGAAA